VLSIQQGSDGVLVGVITLIGVAFAAWLYGGTFQVSPLRGAVSAMIALAVVGVGLWSVGNAGPLQTSATDVKQTQAGPEAEPYTRARLDALLEENRPVFINLTAAWCITCKVNERVALRSQRIADAFDDRGVAYLVGDWTNGNEEITALLKDYDRVGVPLYLVYSGKPQDSAQILPQLLTESIILDSLSGISGEQRQARKAL